MPATTFLPNLLLLAVGVTASICLLRTGMVRRGVLLLIALLAAADAALLARWAFDTGGAWFLGSLAAMQTLAVAAAVWLLCARARRRWSSAARQRDAIFAAGFACYLRDELPAAAAHFTRLRRADPWDAAAAIALGNVLRQQGRERQAQRLWRFAHGVDVRGEYRDLIGELRVRAAARRRRA